MANLAVIGGTGLDEMLALDSGDTMRVTTRFGSVDVIGGRLGGIELVFVPRHGLDHSIPPSLINYRAQIAGLKSLGVRRVVGVAAVGSLEPDLGGGSFAVLRDFIDLTKRRADTFFDEPGAAVVHTDFTEPYCPEVSSALIEACAVEGVRFREDAIYVGVEGPRYETPAEVRLYASWGGHVVGMTNVPEAALAREAGLCYGAVAVVSNLACGLSPTPLTHDNVRAVVTQAGESLVGIIRRALSGITSTPRCLCASNTGLEW